MLYYFEYYSGDYDDKSLILKEMSEACKNNKLDEFIMANRTRIVTFEDKTSTDKNVDLPF